MAIADRVSGWVTKDYPLRPGKMRPIIPQKAEFGRHRPKSPDRRRSQEREPTQQQRDANVDVWQICENEENLRRGLLTALNKARRELSEIGRVTDEMKFYSQATIDGAPNSDAKVSAIDLLENIPTIERINELKRLTAKGHDNEVRQQYEDGVLKIEAYRQEAPTESQGFQETPKTQVEDQAQGIT